LGNLQYQTREEGRNLENNQQKPVLEKRAEEKWPPPFPQPMAFLVKVTDYGSPRDMKVT
jgi:hypothetical protein